MAEKLTVYAYNVFFGDAILVEVPDAGTKRYILIDVGNVLIDKGSEDKPLLDAIDDIIVRTKGKIDLYVMTHEHMDHVQGLAYAANQGRTLSVDTVWLTASAAPDYYDKNKHPKAREKKLALQEAVATFQAVLGAAVPQDLRGMLAVNAGATGVLGLNARSTKECVQHIREMRPGNLHYVYRGYAARGSNPFKEAKLRILAPEEDTSDYYGRAKAQLTPGAQGPSEAGGRPLPLSGIDGGAFYDLVESMDRGFAESLLSIDRAENNTSVVIELEWRGRRLLFTGDAEQRSWRMMADKAGLQPVDLLKVGHHGSGNATPPVPILDLILPPARKRSAVAVLSTCTDVYNDVPSPAVRSALESRTRTIHETASVDPGKPVKVSLSAGR